MGSGSVRLRTPVVCVLGHVDHGKTTLLDTIRGTRIASKEPGQITQHVGATLVPLEIIHNLCSYYNPQQLIQLPGLLFIDTPGHHAFSSLRARGGSLADLAVLVVDIIEGFKPQTLESLQLLKRFNTCFLIAANKIDRIPGWKSSPMSPFGLSYPSQSPSARKHLDELIYSLVESCYHQGLSAERYDRIRDFSSNLAIVPISAKTGEGIPELLLVLLGLAQRFLKHKLVLSSEMGAGTILEMKPIKGTGLVLDVILWDGEIHQGDQLVIATLEGYQLARVKGILVPAALSELRACNEFLRLKSISAAAGVRIVVSELQGYLAGMPLRSIRDKSQLQQAISQLSQEISELKITTDQEGVTIKSDSVGGLEALIHELRSQGINIARAELGQISKRDVEFASLMKSRDPGFGAVIGFGVDILPDAQLEAQSQGVKIFLGDVIYQLVEEFLEWYSQQSQEYRIRKLEGLILPGKLRILPYIFRISKPAIVGIQVESGIIKPGVPLVREDGYRIGKIKEIQSQNRSLDQATSGQQVAISIDGPTVGRQIKPGQILYVDVPQDHISRLLELRKLLDEEMLELLEEFSKMRYGISSYL